MVRSQTLLNRTVDFTIILVLAVIAIISLYPLWYTIALSFSDQAAANAGKVTAWPIGFNLTSYQIILDDEKFFRAFGVSVTGNGARSFARTRVRPGTAMHRGMGRGVVRGDRESAAAAELMRASRRPNTR